MQIERIRAQLEEGQIIERQTGVLHQAIVNLAELNGVSVTVPEVRRVIDFVTEYIEHAPALMLVIEEAAAQNDTQADVQPILDAAEDYFLAPNDIIPDHYGLAGLLDDAYLTHVLVEVISDRWKAESGTSLLPMDAHEINTFIRRLIGEPFVSILDDHVSTTLDRLSGEQNINEMLVVLAQMNLSSVPDPIWGDAHVTEITGARLEAIGVF
jgi:uncharacterized membrane protein YkvA (DUF1232 family)